MKGEFRYKKWGKFDFIRNNTQLVFYQKLISMSTLNNQFINRWKL